MGCCKCFFRAIRNLLIVFFLVVLLPGLPPKTHFDLTAFTVPKPLNLTGPLEVNNLLDNVEHLLEGQIYGPESLVHRGNDIFASLHGGEVVKITGDHITHVAKFGKPCEGPHEESLCGRPLGLSFDTIGDNLIVNDAYYGLWQVDLKTGKKTQLISPKDELDGKIRRPAKLFNSVAVSKSGDIFWTDSSSDFGLEDGVATLLANPSGRLFQYNRATKQNKVLIDEINFANGVALSPNEDFVLIAETGSSAIRRYYLKGPKAGQNDVFVDQLPGYPDNLTPDSEGLWVALAIAIDNEHPAILQSLTKTPLVRKFLLRVLALAELPFKLVDNVYPNIYSKIALRSIGHFESVSGLEPPRTTILRVDWSGKIIGSLHGFDGTIRALSHVLEVDDYLYLGSFANRYLGRVKLPKSYQKLKASAAAASKPTTAPTTPTTTTTTTTTKKPATTTTTTPKPAATTTTTPKPATTTTTTTTPKPTTTTTAKPKVTTTPKPVTTTTTKKPTPAPEKAREPAPVHEHDPRDAKPTAPPKLNVIKKGGEQGEF